MTASDIHTALDKGAVLNVTASGVTFPCVVNSKVHRQDAIELMQEGVEAEDRDIDLVYEPDNKYDIFAIRLDYEGLDVGYIPKKGDITITQDGKSKRSYTQNVNQILCEYDKELECECDTVYGGYACKFFGFSVNVWAVE